MRAALPVRVERDDVGEDRFRLYDDNGALVTVRDHGADVVEGFYTSFESRDVAAAVRDELNRSGRWSS